jgi:hypothetical protein
MLSLNLFWDQGNNGVIEYKFNLPDSKSFTRFIKSVFYYLPKSLVEEKRKTIGPGAPSA